MPTTLTEAVKARWPDWVDKMCQNCGGRLFYALDEHEVVATCIECARQEYEHGIPDEAAIEPLEPGRSAAWWQRFMSAAPGA